MANLKKTITKFSNLAKNSTDQYLIVMVCNVKGVTKTPKDYQATSVESEYYSLKQYFEISETIKKLGFSIKVYFDEIDFIEDFSSKKLRDNYPKKIIVLNSAQKGIFEGRKSLIPAFCDLNGLIHTNSNSYTSSFSRNKYHWYSVLRNSKTNICNSWLFDGNLGWLFDEIPKEGMKVICKLNSESSSIGLSSENIFTFTKDKENFIRTMSQKFNQRIIVQEFIDGKEVEVPILLDTLNECSMDPVGIKIGNERNLGTQILDYNIRGNNKFSFYNFTKNNKQIADKLKKNSQKVARELDIFGFGRIDYRIDKHGNYFVTDISTNPHLTKSMSIYYAFKQLGFNYDHVLLTLFGLAISRNQGLTMLDYKTLPSGKNIFLKREMATPDEWISVRQKIGWDIHSEKIHFEASQSTLYGVTIYNERREEKRYWDSYHERIVNIRNICC